MNFVNSDLNRLSFVSNSLASQETNELLEDILRQVESIVKPWTGFALDSGGIDIRSAISELQLVGLFALAVGEKYDGLELPLPSLGDVARRLARVDLSLALLFVDHSVTARKIDREESLDTDSTSQRIVDFLESGTLLLSGFQLKNSDRRAHWNQPFSNEPSQTSLGLRAFRFSVTTDEEKFDPIALSETSILLSACALGALEKVHNLAQDQAQLRIQFKKPIDRNTSVREQLLEMRWKIATLERLLVHFSRPNENQNMDLESLKTLCDFAWRSALYGAERCVQIFGGNGFMEDTNVPHWLRDVKTASLFCPFSNDAEFATSIRTVESWIPTEVGEIGEQLDSIRSFLSRFSLWNPSSFSEEGLARKALDDTICMIVHFCSRSESTLPDPFLFSRTEVGTWFQNKIQSYERYVRNV